MCCCGKPVINGQPGYKWQPDHQPGIYPVNPPDLQEGDRLVFDEPGRCGGLDAHSHHFRLVNNIGLTLLVRHGGGDERVPLSHVPTLESMLAGLDSNARYWLLHTIYHAYQHGERLAREKTENRWRQAAAENRIKTRKVRGQAAVKVWIEPKIDSR